MATRHPNGNPHAQGGSYGHSQRCEQRSIALQTATPSHIETEVAAFRRRRDVRICAERKLTIHTGPNQDEDHGAEHLCRGLPDCFSGG